MSRASESEVTAGPSAAGALPYSHAGWWKRPRAHDRPALHWHVATRALALALRAAPRRHRFAAARLLARAAAPLARRTPGYDEKRRLGIDGPGEITLHHALSVMAHSGALFDLELEIDGAEHLDAALAAGRGVLVVAPHALLSLSLFRYLYDAGRVPAVVSAAPFEHIYGTRLVVPAVRPSPTFMIRVRSLLRAGGTVCAMIDQEPPGKPRATEFATPGGIVRVSDSLIRLALRCGAEVVFHAARLDRRRGLVLSFAAPRPAARASAEAITQDFVAFVSSHVHAASA